MLARLRDRLTYANVVSTLALFVALGGSAYAVGEITSRDIKNRTIKAGDVRRDTLTGKEINEARMGQVPSARQALNANNAVNADISKSADSANTAGSAGTAAVANIANDAQRLAGQGAAAFEQSSTVQFGRASVDPSGESGERVLLSWPELGAQLTTATDQASCAGQLRIAMLNTRSSGSPLRMLEQGAQLDQADPGEKQYACDNDNPNFIDGQMTDASGRVLYVDCIVSDAELRCIGLRSEP
jgi:hypothetical protein